MERSNDRRTRYARPSMLPTLCVLAGLTGCASTTGPALDRPVASPTAVSSPEAVRVVALNVAMLPGPFGRDNVRRAEEIADHVLLDPGADVIVLVECFDEPSRAVFSRRLARTHPWMARHAGGGVSLREDSGLFLASRLPFVGAAQPRVHFEAFRARGPVTRADYWCAKGVLGTELELGKGRSLCVFATHLQADYESLGQYAAVRAAQLRQVRRFAEAFLAEVAPDRRACPLLVGDLNISAEGWAPGGPSFASSAEYEALTSLLDGPVDLFRQTNPGAPGWTWNHDRFAPGFDPAHPPQRLDYALRLDGLVAPVRRWAAEPVWSGTVTLEPGLSDHRALAVELAVAAEVPRFLRESPPVEMVEELPVLARAPRPPALGDQP